MNSRGTRPHGVLYLVVGASGVGKDTLIASARAALSGAGTHLFAHRVVTRPPDAGGEDHESVSPAKFAELVAERALALEWSAHGLRYGIRRSATDELSHGTHVVANVSRSMIDRARAAFRPVRVVSITASAPVLRERLLARGRESAREIEARLARAAATMPRGPDVVTIRNDGTLEEAARLFIEALSSWPSNRHPLSY